MKKAIYILMCTLGFFNAKSQSISDLCQYKIRNFTTKDTKAHRQNWSIAQSPINNFIYIANSAGLLEFDGSHWKLHKLKNKQNIRSVFINTKGKIFTGALGEFGYWNENATGELQYHSLRHLIKDQNYKNEEFWNIIQTPEGIIFQSFAYMYLYNGNGIEKINLPSNVLFMHRVNNRFYINAIDKGGLFEYKNKKFIALPNSEWLKSENVNTILPYGNGSNILVGTTKGISVYDGQTFRPFNVALNAFLSKNQLNKGIILPNGNYVFGTIQNGILITDPSGNIIQKYNRNQNLQNNTVLALNTDNQGNIWAGLDAGIALVPLSSAIKYYDDPSGELGTLYDTEIFENKLYLATNHGLFYKAINNSNEAFKRLPNTEGYSLKLTKVGTELLLGHNNGVFSIKNNQATLISKINGGTNLVQISGLPNVYIQGSYTSFLVYRLENNLKFDHKIDSFIGPVEQMEQVGPLAFLLKTTNKGLQYIEFNQDLTANKVLKKLDADFEVRSMANIRGEILIYTNKGIMIFKNGKITEYAKEVNIKKAFDLKQFGVWKLTEDHNFENQNQKTLPINADSWVLDNENIKLLNNEILLAKENGFEIINGSNLLGTKHKPYVRGISYGDNFEESLFFDKSTNHTPAFSASNNSLRVFFGLVDYSYEVRFKYMFEGKSNTWTNVGDKNLQEFMNLAPDTYTLLVKSNISSEISSFKFVINNPWYWNIWSKLLYIIAIALLIRYAYCIHNKKLKHQNDVLESEKLKALEDQENQNKQELIRLRNEQLEKDVARKTEELAESTIKLIKRNELLKKLKEEVQQLDLPKSNPQIIKLIDNNLNATQEHHVFEKNFNKIHEEFFKRMLDKYPSLSQGDLKLCAYLKMNLSSKEIGQLLNITFRSVELKRYRLRQKLELTPETNLSVWLMGI